MRQNMDDVEDVPDGSKKGVGLCGITRNTGTIDWVCVRPIHDNDSNKNRIRQINGYYPQSERHYFRPKYAMREEKK